MLLDYGKIDVVFHNLTQRPDGTVEDAWITYRHTEMSRYVGLQAAGQLIDGPHPYTHAAHFAEFVSHIQSGAVLRVDDQMYYYWRDVLPPRRGAVRVTWPDGFAHDCDFIFCEGADIPTAFFSERFGTAERRYFARLVNASAVITTHPGEVLP